MSFTDVFKKIFGTKADRDLKALQPMLNKVLDAYKTIDKLSDDELREHCQGLKDKIKAAIAADEARIAEIKVELEKDIPLSKKEALATESDKLVKKVDEIIAEGTSVVEPYCKIDDPSIVLEIGRPVNYEYIVSGKATAYTAPMGAYTASGRLAEIGTCAVNPNVIPYGSKLYIVGQNDNVCYGYAIAADTGDGMMDGTIPVDLYMGNCEDHFIDSCEWGLQYVDIYVIEVGDNEYLW